MSAERVFFTIRVGWFSVFLYEELNRGKYFFQGSYFTRRAAKRAARRTGATVVIIDR